MAPCFESHYIVRQLLNAVYEQLEYLNRLRKLVGKIGRENRSLHAAPQRRKIMLGLVCKMCRKNKKHVQNQLVNTKQCKYLWYSILNSSARRKKTA